jgi:hypothetical protein
MKKRRKPTASRSEIRLSFKWATHLLPFVTHQQSLALPVGSTAFQMFQLLERRNPRLGEAGVTHLMAEVDGVVAELDQVLLDGQSVEVGEMLLGPFSEFFVHVPFESADPFDCTAESLSDEYQVW